MFITYVRPVFLRTFETGARGLGITLLKPVVGYDHTTKTKRNVDNAEPRK